MNISPASKASLFLSAWLGSLAVAILCALYPAAEPVHARCDHGAPSSREEALQNSVHPERPDRTGELFDLNSELRHRCRLLEGELEILRESAPKKDGPESPSDAPAHWTHDIYLDRLLSDAEEGDSSDSTADAIALVVALARSGDQGIAYLCQLADSEDPRERELALWSLAFIPDAAALEAVMGYPWDDEDAVEDGEDDPESRPWSWDVVKRHIHGLPTGTLEPYMESFEGRLEQQEIPMRGAELEVCAQLALRHGQAGSRELLDLSWERLTVGGKNALINSLRYTETDLAMDFLQNVEQTDEHVEVREHAGQAFLALSGALRSE